MQEGPPPYESFRAGAGTPSRRGTKREGTMDRCQRLLATWSQALAELQVTTSGNPRLDGALLCPACGRIHGRCADAMHPFLVMARMTGDDRWGRARKAPVRVDGGNCLANQRGGAQRRRLLMGRNHRVLRGSAGGLSAVSRGPARRRHEAPVGGTPCKRRGVPRGLRGAQREQRELYHRLRLCARARGLAAGGRGVSPARHRSHGASPRMPRRRGDAVR